MATGELVIFSKYSHKTVKTALNCCLSPKLLSVLLVLVTFVINLPAEDNIIPGERLRIERISNENGLSANSIANIVQDKFGYIWIATTFQGLCRYNGSTITTYKHSYTDSSSLSSNRIRSIFIDSGNNLWVSGVINIKKQLYGFLDKYDYDSGTFQHIFPADSLERTKFTAACIEEDNYGRLYAGGNRNTLLILSQESGDYTYKIINLFVGYIAESMAKDSYKDIYSIVKYGKDKLLIGLTDIGIVEYDVITGIFDYEKYAKLNRYLKKFPKRTNTIFVNRSGTFWLGTQYGLIRYNPDTQTIRHYLKTPDTAGKEVFPTAYSPQNFRRSYNIRSICEDPFGKIWIVGDCFGQSEVFFEMDPSTETFLQYKTDPIEENLTPIDNLSKIFLDRSNVFWLSTQNNGLLKFPLAKNFVNVTHLSDIDTRQIIYDMFADHEDNIWFACSDNIIYMYNTKLHFSEKYIIPDQGSYIYDIYRPKHLFSIYEDRHYNIWIGTVWGFEKFDRHTKAFTHFDLDSTRTNSGNKEIKTQNSIHAIHEDRNGLFWLGTEEGLYSYNLESGKNKRYLANPEKFSADINNIKAIYEDDIDNLWIATEDGLLKFDKNTGTFFNPTTQSYNKEENLIYTLTKARNGNILFASKQDGLTNIDPKTGTITNAQIQSILGGQIICGIIEDRHNNLWLKLPLGLIKYNPESRTSVLYDRQDNVRFFISEIYRSSNSSRKNICQLKSGWIYVCGDGNITIFHPDSLNDKSLPQVTIESFQTGQNQTVPKSANIKKVVLPWYNDNFTISFSLLDYYDVKQNKYLYKLDGLDSEWKVNGNLNSVTYLHVKPAHYTFRVVGINSDGMRSVNEATIDITIYPPFWQRLWFKLVMILLSFSAVMLVFYRRIAAAHRQRLVLESLVVQRTQELSEKTAALQQAHNQLEDKVLERTQELASANDDLKHEIEIRRQAEESLKQSEEIARVLINAPVDLAMLIDPKGNILALNKSAAEHFKTYSNGIINHNLIEFLPSTVADSRYKYLQKCLKSRLPQEFEDENLGRIYKNHFYPVVGMDGNVISIAVYARDITEQKKMEKFLQNARIELEKQVDERTEELKQINRKLTREISTRINIETKLRTSEEKYRDLFQNANDLIWISDDNGKFLSINNHLKSFSGYSQKELLLINPIMLIQPEDRFRIIRRYRQVLKNRTTDVELNTITKNGEVHPIWLKMRPIIKNDQIIGVHGIGRDISELRRAQNEIRESEEQKRESLRQFTLRLAHEIKNPLASIKSSAQLVAASGDVINPQIEKHMDVINRNVNICNKVIQDLYSYTHLNGYQFEEKDTQKLIQNLNTFLNEKMTENPNVKITLKVDRDLPFLFIDEYHLAQAFRNIINNAIEAIPDKGKLELTVRVNHSNKTITFECKDNGVGIPADNLSQIFQPFYSSKSKGFGLGLPFAKEIIENHHGTISVSSVAKRGTTFKVILPTM